MYQYVAVAVRIGVSFIAVGAITAIAWLGLFMLTWLAGADWSASLIEPTRFIRYEFYPAEGPPTDPSELVASIESLNLDVSSEGPSDSPVVTVYGVKDSASVGQLIKSHGFSPQFITTGYDMWMMGDIVARSSGPFAMLMIAQFIGFGVVGWHHWRKRVKPQETALGRAILIGLGLGVGAVATGTLIELLLKLLNTPVQEQFWVAETLSTGGATTALFAAMIVFAGPLAEELFFRGFVFRLLRDRTTTPVAYLVSAGIFAGIHLNPSAVILYFLYGVVCAYALQRTGRLMTAVAAHSVINLVGVVSVMA